MAKITKVYHRAYQTLIDKAELSRVVKARRGYYGINQTELAKLANIARGVISDIECQRRVSMAATTIVLDALGLRVTMLIEPKEDQQEIVKFSSMQTRPIVQTTAQHLGSNSNERPRRKVQSDGTIQTQGMAG